MTPLLSVVIPTHKRPQELPTAIGSALHAAPNNDVEVIVVPNGKDASWKAAAQTFKHETRVQWHPVGEAHACIARNHGMAVARGKYIRFLDDDDFLLASGAQAQCTLMERTGADICSAPIQALNKNLEPYAILYQPDTPDFTAGLLSHQRMSQPTAHLFLRRAVRDIQWDESLAFSQDSDWTLRIPLQSDLSWVKTDVIAGAWVRHTNTRISRIASMHTRKRIVAERLIQLIENLEGRGALTEHRREAAARGLWDCVHQALFSSPYYWSDIARFATKLSPGSRPDLRMHEWPLFLLNLSPLRLEFLVAPKRLAAYALRHACLRVGLLDRW